jgi:hypothetical protein
MASWRRGPTDFFITREQLASEYLFYDGAGKVQKVSVFDCLVRKESDGLLGHSAYRNPTHAPIPTCRIPRSSSTKEDHFVDASSSCKDHLQYGRSRNGNIILKEDVQVKWLL